MADISRLKQIDLNNMTSEQRENVEKEMDKVVSKVINDAEKKLKFLNNYGLGFKMIVSLTKLGKEEQQIEKLIGCKIYKKRKQK